MIQKIRIKSDLINFKTEPQKDDEVEQRLTLNRQGRIWYTGYQYGKGYGEYVIGRKEYRKITQEDACYLLDLIEQGLNNDEREFCCDCGIWDMDAVDEKGHNIHIDGSAGSDLIVNNISISNELRRLIRIDDMVIFN